MTKVKIFLSFIIFLILETCILNLSVAITMLNQYKVKGMTGKILKENFSNYYFILLVQYQD